MKRHYSADDTEADAATQYDQEDAMKCECRIVMTRPPRDRIDMRNFEIRYCPLHQEAGRLLEAVQRLSDEHLKHGCTGCGASQFADKVSTAATKEENTR